MKIVKTIAELKEALGGCDKAKIGFVPTMGALHAGHIALVERARRENNVVVVSVFVNPTQFNDARDLRNYPRTPDSDADMLRAAGADIVFMPSVEEVYPEPDARVFDFGLIDKVMEGATRPGHFNGVAQVVSRLFDMVQPDRAYFGEKDFQQIAVIKALVRQSVRFNGNIQIIECPIIREADGLAMSSRNTLLTPEHRAAAPTIYAALQQGAAKKGQLDIASAEQFVKAEIEKSPLLKVIYFQIVDADTLQPVEKWGDARSLRGCIAVQAGNVRLIDNIDFN
jgi:pantoate--beta-alanine ligase